MQFTIQLIVVLGRIVLSFYAFWLVWRVLLPWLPGPADADERIAPYARYFTDPVLVPVHRVTGLPVRGLATISLVAVAAALAALPS